MPRPLWTGSLNFGLVNVPVRLTSAVRDLDLHFRQLHAKDHEPLETRRVCSKEDKEVDYEEIGNAYDLDGEQVILTDEELSAADPKKTRTIEIESFVELEEIDPIYFDHPYYLIPAGETDGTVRAYRLLAEVMGKTDRVALGRFVLRTKEYLVAIRARRRRRADQEGRARARRGDDRGDVGPVGPRELRGRVPQAPAGDRDQEAQGRRDQGAEGRQAGRRARPGPDGRARGDPRPHPEGRRRPSATCLAARRG
jgi:hypothetical protein